MLYFSPRFHPWPVALTTFFGRSGGSDTRTGSNAINLKAKYRVSTLVADGRLLGSRYGIRF